MLEINKPPRGEDLLYVVKILTETLVLCHYPCVWRPVIFWMDSENMQVIKSINATDLHLNLFKKYDESNHSMRRSKSDLTNIITEQQSSVTDTQSTDL